MSDKLEIVRGSGNVFRDLGRPNADAEKLRALLAAEIIKTLDERKLTVRAAGEKTGIAAADFSRLRQVKLDRPRSVQRELDAGLGGSRHALLPDRGPLRVEHQQAEILEPFNRALVRAGPNHQPIDRLQKT